MKTEEIEIILDKVFQYSRREGYKGYNKHDGLNSPILRGLCGWGRWPRIVAIQSVMRFPINMRPWLLAPKVYNPKGLALFSMGLMNRYRATGIKKYMDEATELLGLLMGVRSPGEWSGSCWGYHYPWQDLGFFAPTNTPNAVVTSFVCESFLTAYELTGKSEYLDTVKSATCFFMNDLTELKNENDELCMGYMPLPMTMRVMDVSVLIGAVLARYGMLSGDTKYRDDAKRLVTYVVNQQTEEGAWFYTDPPEDSPIRHDNYHTGFILDALWRYMEAADDYSFRESHEQGLKFYAENLFNEDGSPRWMSDTDYPHDIHGSAQGILTFSRRMDDYGDLAIKIANWALANMYNTSKGRFYYQQTALFTKRFTLLRWCNGWMSLALSNLLVNLAKK